MALSDIASITISLSTSALKAVGFGTPMILGYHAKNTDLTREYTELSQMTTDGFAATDPEYLAASYLTRQTPRVKKWKIGRLTAAFTQIVHMTPINVATGAVYSYTIYSGSQTYDVTVTAGAGDVAADVIGDLITAQGSHITGVTASDGTTKLILTATAGKIFYIKNWSSNLRITDETADPGTSLATQLDNIKLADDDWYGLCLTLNAQALTKVASDWVESAGSKMMTLQTSDWDALVAAEHGDIGYVLKAATQGRTAGMFRGTDTGQYACAALLGNRLPAEPGSDTWASKTLVGITVDPLTPTQIAGLVGKNYIPYIATATVSHTLNGKVFGGEYADTVRFNDWLEIRMAEDLALLFLGNPKVPYTDAGITSIQGTVQKRLELGVAQGGLDGKRPITVTVPKRADVPDADVLARVLNGVTFRAYPAGAIHFVSIVGTLAP